MEPGVTEYTLKNRYVQMSLHVLSFPKHKPIFSGSNTQRMHMGFSWSRLSLKIRSNMFTIPKSLEDKTLWKLPNTLLKWKLYRKIHNHFTQWNNIIVSLSIGVSCLFSHSGQPTFYSNCHSNPMLSYRRIIPLSGTKKDYLKKLGPNYYS